VTSSSPNFLSVKPIPTAQRLIVALDLPETDDARKLVADLDDSVGFYKIGLELFMTGDAFALADELVEQGKEVFVDLKLFDVPNTVAGAVSRLQRRNVTFATVHGNQNMLAAACEQKGSLKVLGVTVLTSLDEDDLRDLGFQCSPRELVLSRAKRAIEVGCDGVVSSGLEAPALRADLGQNFMVVCPGIRPVANVDDQKRTVDVGQAFRNGADYIVVGRPIVKAESPRRAAEDVQQKIAAVFAGG